MAAASFAHRAEARAALRAIVSDPAHGPAALDSSQTVANLLQDLLPDAPRESGLLVAAVRAGLPGALRGYFAQGIDFMTAVGLAAASFSERTAFAPEACRWVATELALALGLADGDVVGAPGYATEIAVPPGASTEGGAAGGRPPAGRRSREVGRWQATLSGLEAEHPAAADLAWLIACLAPAPVPLRLLLASADAGGTLSEGVAGTAGLLSGGPRAQDEAVGTLARCSLLTEIGAGVVLMKGDIREALASQLPADARHAAEVLVEAAIPADTDAPETWPACAALLPHALAVLAPGGDAMARIANYVGERGSYAEARDMHGRLARARERELGPDHPDTLTARANLAYWTGQAGDAPAARDSYADLVADITAVLGPEHPEALAARGNHGHWTGEAGDAAAARDMLAELAADFPEALSDIAHWTGEAGDAAAARDMLAELVADVEATLGPEHREALAAFSSLADWTGKAGDPATARDMHAELLADSEAILGPQHPDTLTVRGDLAHWTGKAGDPATARDMFAALLPACEATLATEHPDTLAARRNLARWTGEAGEPAAARNLLAQLLRDYQQILGLRHPDTLTTMSDLADWTGEAGDPAAARDSCAALQQAREQALGPRHPDTLATRHDLADWTGQAGDPAAARNLLAALLDDCQRILGPPHPSTVTTSHSLAYWARRARSRP